MLEDHSGNPLASVELRVAKEGVRQLVADLETDGSGRFHAEGIPAGDYRIDVSKPNYVPLTLRTRLAAGSPPMALRLVRFGVIAGRVGDAGGRPIPGVAIQIMTRGAGGAIQPFGYARRLDDTGQYRVYDLPPGEYAVALSYGAAGAAGSSGGTGLRSSVGSGVRLYPDNQRPQWFTVAGGEEYANTDFSIIATALFKVSGKVEAEGKRFTVALTPVDQPLMAAASQRLEENGEFQLEGIPPGLYDLYASGPTAGYGGMGVILAPGPLFGRLRVQVAGQDVTGLVVAVRKGVTASFILRPASPNQPASACPPHATLRLSPVEATAASLQRTAEVNLVKPQVLEDLGPAHYRVSVSGLGQTCYSPAALVDLTAPASETIAVTVAPAASVRGRLSGPAARPTNFVVVLLGLETDGTDPVQVAYPDADLRFSFGSLRPGRYRIGVYPTADAARARWVSDKAGMIDLDLPGGAPTDLDLPAPVEKEP
ncbi:MAG: carboxypeptidase-like regulatory domain-containing protein [Acidobacteriia bacterium]|nr:carboxypeptidase-like regulatory domain-containing protein [Terriglobia bacterium]